MTNKIDIESISKDVWLVLQKHGLAPDAYGLVLTLPDKDFDVLVADHPDRTHPEMVMKTVTESNGLQWFVQIMRRRSLGDFPPGAILTLSPDEL